MNKNLFSLFKISLIAISCSSIKTTTPQAMAKQGIEGYVYRISGNQMPSPDAKPTPPKGIKTDLYFYQLTNINQVERQGQSAFYYSIKTKLIAKIETDTNGYFKIDLDPGRYSVFAKKDKLFYANWFDKDNNIAPAEVLPGKISQVEFRIDYDAVY